MDGELIAVNLTDLIAALRAAGLRYDALGTGGIFIRDADIVTHEQDTLIRRLHAALPGAQIDTSDKGNVVIRAMGCACGDCQRRTANTVS